MKKIVLLFFIFFAITARVDFAKASTVDKDALRDFFILNIGTSYGFKQ